jgi:hypothetical protein
MRALLITLLSLALLGALVAGAARPETLLPTTDLTGSENLALSLGALRAGADRLELPTPCL